MMPSEIVKRYFVNKRVLVAFALLWVGAFSTMLYQPNEGSIPGMIVSIGYDPLFTIAYLLPSELHMRITLRTGWDMPFVLVQYSFAVVIAAIYTELSERVEIRWTASDPT